MDRSSHIVLQSYQKKKYAIVHAEWSWPEKSGVLDLALGLYVNRRSQAVWQPAFNRHSAGSIPVTCIPAR